MPSMLMSFPFPSTNREAHVYDELLAKNPGGGESPSSNAYNTRAETLEKNIFNEKGLPRGPDKIKSQKAELESREES